MNKYIELDSPDGIFAIPNKLNINMLELREYCKINNINYEDLADEEIEKFRIK